MNTLTHNVIASNDVVYEASGRHLLLKLSGCESSELNDEDSLVSLADKAAQATGATVLQIISHRFDPQGVTVLVMLAESHASLHSYPESGVLFWDCFTCGQTCNPELSATILEATLKHESVSKQVAIRD